LHIAKLYDIVYNEIINGQYSSNVPPTYMMVTVGGQYLQCYWHHNISIT